MESNNLYSFERRGSLAQLREDIWHKKGKGSTIEENGSSVTLRYR
jgi:hypothetical protein